MPLVELGQPNSRNASHSCILERFLWRDVGMEASWLGDLSNQRNGHVSDNSISIDGNTISLRRWWQQNMWDAWTLHWWNCARYTYRLLESSDFAECDGARSEPVRLLYSTAARRYMRWLSSSLVGQLLPGSLAARVLSCCLLCSCHFGVGEVVGYVRVRKSVSLIQEVN
jgi:hypothetical protein